MFSNISRRTTIFAAEREHLQKTESHQNNRRQDTRFFVGRQGADQYGRQAHYRYRNKERIFTSDDVSDPTEKQCSKRSNTKAGPECRQARQISRHVISGWKEKAAEKRS